MTSILVGLASGAILILWVWMAAAKSASEDIESILSPGMTFWRYFTLYGVSVLAAFAALYLATGMF